MKVCLAPNGSYLPAEHQAFLRELLGAFAAAEYRKSKLEAVLPALVRQLSARCSSDALLGAWCEEVGQLRPPARPWLFPAVIVLPPNKVSARVRGMRRGSPRTRKSSRTVKCAN